MHLLLLLLLLPIAVAPASMATELDNGQPATAGYYEVAKSTWSGLEVMDVGFQPYVGHSGDPRMMLLECMLRVRQIEATDKLVLEQRCIVFTFASSQRPRCFIGQVALRSCGLMEQVEEPSYELKVFVRSLYACWITIQQRVANDVDFKLPWASYAAGFGNFSGGSFWLGLRQIHKLTQPKFRRLRASMTLWNGTVYWADFTNFLVGSEAEQFTLKSLGSFQPSVAWLTNDMNTNRLMNFSTIDVDNDNYHSSCSNVYHGGWWYRECIHANPNGKYFAYPLAEDIGDYGKGIVWGGTFGYYYSMKAFRMMIW